VAGVAMGSLVWVSVLASATAVARRVLARRVIRVADAVAGLGLLGFGGVLAYAAARER
jgi:putative LysE/RhtB family amino acid efflux pump